MRTLSLFVGGCAAALALHLAAQTPPPEFLRRVADNYRAAMTMNDNDKDGQLTREEARGSVLLEARFDDIDTNRDRVITREELERYLSTIPATAR